MLFLKLCIVCRSYPEFPEQKKFVTMDVLGNDKRWLVTLVTSNKVVAPVLQDIVKQGMDKLYALLNNYLNGLPTPYSLQTLTMQRYAIWQQHQVLLLRLKA